MRRTVFAQLRAVFVGQDLGADNGKYSSGILAPNGKIYYAPYSASRILEFNPVTLTTQYVGATLTDGGSAKHNGGCLAPNGKIYFAPTGASRILEFDPNTYATQYVGSDLGTAIIKHVGGCLAPNGKIYFTPHFATQVLEFNPATLTTQYVGAAVFGIGKATYTSALGADGNIYFCPNERNKIARFNPNTYDVADVGSDLGSGVDKYSTIMLGLDNKLYFAPRNKSQIMRYDPVTSLSSDIGQIFSPGNFHGLEQSPNGNIYLSPINTNNRVFELNPVNLSGRPVGGIIVGNFAKYTSFILAPNGKIYGCPWRANRILQFTPANLVVPAISDLTIPSNLSTLPTSNYNRFYNKY